MASCPLRDDILIEILSRLPLHALLRFKKVSKSFRKLTAEAFWLRPKTTSSAAAAPAPAAFIVRDERHGRSNVVRLGSSSNDTVNVDDDALLPPSEDPKHHHLLATCNGLLLYRDTTASGYERGCEVYRVSNPVTQQWFRLPPVFRYGTVCVDFDPKISPHFRVAQFEACRTLMYIDVFDSQLKTWCKVDDIEVPMFVQHVRSCVLVGDVLYADMCYDYGSTVILKVDIRERSCVAIKVPGASYDYNMPPSACSSLCSCKCGRVHYLDRSYGPLRMWVLYEEKEESVCMFSCHYASLNEQIGKQLSELHSDSERLRICHGGLFSDSDSDSEYDERVELVDFYACDNRTDFLLTPDHTVFVPVQFGRDCTAIAHYDFRTKTVSEVSVINVLADGLFAF